jgi:hypothetical protein
MPQNLGSYFVPATALIAATVPLVSAFYFPHWRLTWWRRGKVPMSVRGKIVIGIYFAYFGLLFFVGSDRIRQLLFFAGWMMLMAATYRAYLRDRRDYENSIWEK